MNQKRQSINILARFAPLAVEDWIFVGHRDSAKVLIYLFFSVFLLFPPRSLNFSKPSAPIFAQYYSFVRLGREGYTKIMQSCLSEWDASS